MAWLTAPARAGRGLPAALAERNQRPRALGPIVAAVCAAFRITPAEIISRRRGQHVALAPQVAIYLVLDITGYSFPRIGEYFGRDHSTVIHSQSLIARRVAAEPAFDRLLSRLRTTVLIS